MILLIGIGNANIERKNDKGKVSVGVKSQTLIRLIKRRICTKEYFLDLI
jgi:hypothetical protein